MVPRVPSKGEAGGSLLVDPAYPHLGHAKFLPSIKNREQLVFHYNAEKYNFREVIIEMFKCSEKIGDSFASVDAETALDRIHELTWPGKPLKQGGGRGRSNLTPWHTEYATINRPHGAGHAKSDREKALFERYETILREFCRDVVSPLLGVGPEEDVAIVYQRRPTLRVGMPAKKPMGHPHCDYEYHHQPGEINFWIPLNSVFGSNTLWTETAPGKGDFSPLVLQYGSAIRFWGNQCKHYTVANDSGKTRVSLDFRVIRADRFNPDFVCSRGKPGQFRIGQYYLSTSLDSKCQPTS
jgi:hypothetical protein|eukprot:g9025.t1